MQMAIRRKWSDRCVDGDEGRRPIIFETHVVVSSEEYGMFLSSFFLVNVSACVLLQTNSRGKDSIKLHKYIARRSLLSA